MKEFSVRRWGQHRGRGTSRATLCWRHSEPLPHHSSSLGWGPSLCLSGWFQALFLLSYPIEGLEGTAADSTGLKHRWSRFQGAMAWRDWQELSDSNISIPPTCQAIFFFFFFFNLDVVDITSEILLLALQVCLSAKTLPPGSSFFPLKCKLGRGPQKVVPDPCH